MAISTRVLLRKGKDARCLALTQTRRQRARAATAGADVVLSRDGPIRELNAAVIYNGSPVLQ